MAFGRADLRTPSRALQSGCSMLDDYVAFDVVTVLYCVLPIYGQSYKGK